MFGVILDAVTDALRDGVKARMPGVGTPAALPFIGNDRKIIRGPNETDASYAGRLSRAFHDWRHAGSAISVAQQVLAYITPVTPRIRVVSSTIDFTSGDRLDTWVTLENGVVTFLQLDPGVWNWDSATEALQPSRFWVIVYPGVFQQGILWDDGHHWDDGSLWDFSGVSADFFHGMQRVIQQWKGSHSQCGATLFGGGIIGALDDTIFDPNGIGPFPDGTWANPNNRSTRAVYLNGFE
jgi:hypothetical protein